MITTIAILAILYGIGGIILSKIEILNQPKDQHKTLDILPAKYIVLIVGVIGFALSSCITNIDGQKVGIVLTPTGVSETPLVSGWHLISPFSTVKDMDKTQQVFTRAIKDNTTIWAPTIDGMKMGIDISIAWQIDASQAPWIYSHISAQDEKDRFKWIEDNIINNVLSSVVNNTISEYTPTEVYSSKRQNIQPEIFTRIKKELAARRIILNSVDVKEIHYDHAYEEAIKDKKLAEQKVQQLVQVTAQKQEQLKQASIDKDMAIQTAEGEAKALAIKGTAINSNPKIIELEWIQKWDGHVSQYQLGGGASMLMQMPTK